MRGKNSFIFQKQISSSFFFLSTLLLLNIPLFFNMRFFLMPQNWQRNKFHENINHHESEPLASLAFTLAV